MSDHQRPWWLFVSKPPALDTTIEEKLHPGEQEFIITGQPTVQSMSWLTWGPGAALIIVAIMTALAIGFDIRNQSLLVRGLFIIAFLLLPAIFWLSGGTLVNLLGRKHIAAEVDDERQECIIRLDHKQGELTFRNNGHPSEHTLAFEDIQQARLTHPIGERNVKAMRLTLDTNEGPIVLLDEKLGTHVQKMDLLEKIQQALEPKA